MKRPKQRKQRKKRKQQYVVGRDGPRPVDVYVGRRVHDCRILAGLSQDQLAERLGLTFQQVQKYERGTNRISASKLWDISGILGIPIPWFFEGADEPDTEGEDIRMKRETLELSRAYNALTKKIRRDLLALFKASGEIKDM